MGTKHEEAFKSRHIFQMHEDFLCEEVLYVSSGTHKSGYKYGHKENKGKKHLGETPINGQTLTHCHQGPKRPAESSPILLSLRQLVKLSQLQREMQKENGIRFMKSSMTCGL